MSKISQISRSAWILHQIAEPAADALLHEIQLISQQAPFRHLLTPGGKQIGVEMTNCGELGWFSDRQGYRYESVDPLTGQAWPAMPTLLTELAQQCVALTTASAFQPQSCLINRYRPGVGMGLHQDRDEQALQAPIVSISLGIPALFLFGGMRRSDKPDYHLLKHGDVVVWGNEDRLRFHGIQPIKLANHPLTGQLRYNLTLRQVN